MLITVEITNQVTGETACVDMPCTTQELIEAYEEIGANPYFNWLDTEAQLTKVGKSVYNCYSASFYRLFNRLPTEAFDNIALLNIATMLYKQLNAFEVDLVDEYIDQYRIDSIFNLINVFMQVDDMEYFTYQYRGSTIGEKVGKEFHLEECPESLEYYVDWEELGDDTIADSNYIFREEFYYNPDDLGCGVDLDFFDINDMLEEVEGEFSVDIKPQSTDSPYKNYKTQLLEFISGEEK